MTPSPSGRTNEIVGRLFRYLSSHILQTAEIYGEMYDP